MKPLEKLHPADQDEERFPRSNHFVIKCTKTTLNKNQFQFVYFEGRLYEAYELIPGRDYIVWSNPEQWEAVTGSTFLNYFSLDFNNLRLKDETA